MHVWVLSCFSCVWLFGTICSVAHQAPLSWNSSGENTGAGCHALLQRMFLTQGLNLHLLCLLYWHVGSLPLASPGKPWFIGCHVMWCESHSVVSNCLWSHGLNSPRNSSGENTGVGSFSLLQGIFPTQGSNPGLPYCRKILYQLSHKGRLIYRITMANWFDLRRREVQGASWISEQMIQCSTNWTTDDTGPHSHCFQC